MLFAVVALAVCGACGAPEAGSLAVSGSTTYQALYAVSVDEIAGTAAVELRVRQPHSLLRELRMRPDARISDIDGSGDLTHEDGLVVWRPPAAGGSLRWTVQVDHRRNGDGYDARLGADWGLFRAEDIIPRAATRTLKGASSETRLEFELPPDWSVVTQYAGSGGRFEIDNPERRFDQPNGWIVMGQLGVRRDRLGATQVVVAGPTGHSVRRLDILALLRWTLPELERLLGPLPPRLTIVSAGDPMWRGGLSAPSSLYLHAERPLISENATSTLLHEVMHMGLGLAANPGYDWIVEGLAEYYSLELLHRSGTISADRHEQALKRLEDWSESARSLCAPASTGPATALAVTLLTRLDATLREETAGGVSLDDVARSLHRHGSRVDLDALHKSLAGLGVGIPDMLEIEQLPGCRNFAAN